MTPAAPLLGARRPRICSYPVYLSSAGGEVIELAASAGLILDGWQGDILTAALGERADGTWSAFEVAMLVSRQNGKGGVLEGRALAGLLLFGEKLIMWTAHELKTAMEAFRRVEDLFLNSDDLRRRVKKVSHANGDEGIELRNGARLRFVARSKGSGRGFSGDLVVLDEAYALTAEQIEALMPTLSARPNPQIWYASSPPLDAESGAQLMSVRRRALAGAQRLAYFDWGAEGELEDLSGVNLDDRRLWAATNPAFGIRVSEEFIAMERAAMSPAGFARERLGIWPRDDEGSSAAIDPAMWAALAGPEPTRRDRVAFAIDVTPDRGHAAIAAYVQVDEFGGNLAVVDHREGTDWIVGRLVELRDQWRPVAVALDAKGPAGSLLVSLEKAGFSNPGGKEPRYGDLAVSSASDLAAACGQLVDAVKQGRIHHQGQPELTLAVSGARTRPLGDAWAWARRTATQDISPLVAATLAQWAFQTRAHLVDDYDVLDSVR